jgi:hypothetical protein
LHLAWLIVGDLFQQLPGISAEQQRDDHDYDRSQAAADRNLASG